MRDASSVGERTIGVAAALILLSCSDDARAPRPADASNVEAGVGAGDGAVDAGAGDSEIDRPDASIDAMVLDASRTANDGSALDARADAALDASLGEDAARDAAASDGAAADAGALQAVRSLAAGGSHACAVRADGRAVCWGANVAGQLGNGALTIAANPTPNYVRQLGDVAQVAAGADFSCAALASGSGRCWGANLWGQLGDGTRDNAREPVAVAGLAEVAALTAGGAHACALLRDQTVRCWGANADGQIGNGSRGDGTSVDGPVFAPERARDLDEVVMLASGGYHNCALRKNAAVWCWGADALGQLGNQTVGDPTVPTAVAGLDPVVHIAAGSNFTCAALRDGTVRCWGENRDGQIGRTTDPPQQRTPIVVDGLAEVASVAAGSRHACALKRDGSVWCWGTNGRGELGSDAVTSSTTPLRVPLVSAATALELGDTYSCALTQSSVWCWGNPSAGALGDGVLRPSVTKSAPVQVIDAR